MKILGYLISLVCILSLLTVKGQTPLKPSEDSIFNNRGEIYFKFHLDEKSRVDSISRMISIDNYKDGDIYAYASKTEFLRFLDLNINYTVLPNPSSLVKPEDWGTPPLSPTTMTIWNYYPLYQDYINIMNAFATNYPDICKVETIGSTVQGRQLIAVKISDSVNYDRGVPQVFFTSSMHGDELTGYVMMLHLIDSLLNGYGNVTRITNMVKNTQIYINPLANPDGTFYGGNTTFSGARRYNYNGYDLNRNFPDPINGPNANQQLETTAFINYANSHHFNLAMNFHGGAEVVNFPWDHKYALSADDAWWQWVSKEYADTVHQYGTPGYFTNPYPSGYVRGAVWYVIDGGRQDYHNYFKHVREVTTEISLTKFPAASTLLTFWNSNRKAFLNFIEQANYGINGQVTDSITHVPLKAQVFISGHDIDSSHVWTSLPTGWYFRMINNGTWSLTFSATGYYSKTITVTAARYATTRLNVQLVQKPYAPATLTATTISPAQVDLAWTKNASNNPVLVAFNTVNTFGTPVNGTVYTPGATITGGGTVLYVGPNTSFSHLGLNPGTAYYYRAWSAAPGNYYSDPKSATATTTAIATPGTLTATAAGSLQINLNWTKNASSDPVMVAFNTVNTFGSPVHGTSYSAGSTISGGGTVLYIGANTTFSHLGLNPGTTYYYRAWSVAPVNLYSAPLSANATTQAIASPGTFTASPSGGNQVNLAWTKNPSNDIVMIAFSTINTFGTPVNGTAYSAGSTISGGGTVLYVGPNTSFNHLALDPVTTYYYQAWSVATGNYYSTARTANATTICGISGKYPLSENFTPSSPDLPPCWSQQSSGTFINNWGRSNSNNAGGTACEMRLGRNNNMTGTIQLITYTLNIVGINNLDISFRHSLDTRGTGATLKVQSSYDGNTWNDLWSVSSSNNIPAVLVNIPVSIVNQSTITISFTVTGDLGKINNWYIDDVSIKAPGYWVGGTPGNLTNWNTNTNWGDNLVPTVSTNVYIPQRAYLPVVSNDPATPAACNNIIIAPNATVTVTPGKVLQVNGSFTIQP